MFSDLGIEASVIHNDRNDEDFLNTAWTIQITRGFILFLATTAIAFPFANYYNETLLLYILPVVGLGILIDGFKSTALFTENRNLYLGRLQILEVSVQIIASFVMITIAWFTGSIWALVAGSLIINIIRVASSHLFFRGIRNRLRWDKAASYEIIRFGMWLFISSIATFLAQSGDRLIFGKLIPIGMLGVYSIAYMIGEVPMQLIQKVAWKVLFPSIALIRRCGGDIANAYKKFHRNIIIISGFSSIVLTLLGPFLVSHIYDERYIDASWIIRLFALGIWSNAISHIQGATLLACGRTKKLAIANTAKLVWLFSVVPFAFYQWNFPIAVLCVVLSDLPRYIAGGIGVREDNIFVFLQDIRFTVLFGTSIGIGFFLEQKIYNPNEFACVAISTIVSCIIWLIINIKPIGDFIRRRS